MALVYFLCGLIIALLYANLPSEEQQVVLEGLPSLLHLAVFCGSLVLFASLITQMSGLLNLSSFRWWKTDEELMDAILVMDPSATLEISEGSQVCRLVLWGDSAQPRIARGRTVREALTVARRMLRRGGAVGV